MPYISMAEDFATDLQALVMPRLKQQPDMQNAIQMVIEHANRRSENLLSVIRYQRNFFFTEHVLRCGKIAFRDGSAVEIMCCDIGFQVDIIPAPERINITCSIASHEISVYRHEPI